MNAGPLKHRLKVVAVGSVALGFSSLGISACTTVATTTLPCSVLSNVGKDSVDTVSVKSVAGAKVLTVVSYQGRSAAQSGVTNALGLTTEKFSLGKSTASKIAVATHIVKNGRQATCATSFNRTVGNTQVSGASSAPPLTEAASALWLGSAIGQQLPYNSSSPAASCFPSSGHVGVGDGCGTLAISSLVQGFASYGGTVACPAGTTYCGEDYASEAYLSGSATLSWTLRCIATGVVTPGHSAVNLTPAWQSNREYVSPYTRVDNNSAKLRIAADLPFGSTIAACSGPSTLQSVRASAVHLVLNRAKTNYPNTTFAVPGTFTQTPASS